MAYATDESECLDLAVAVRTSYGKLRFEAPQ
jgi:hypothetical protein